MTDNQIIEKIRGGDANALRFLIQRYKAMSFSLALSISKNYEHSEEIVQDVFFLVFKNIHQFSGKSKFSTWLYKIVLNQSLKFCKKKKLETTTIDTNFVETIDNEYIVLIENEDTKKMVNEILFQLPAKESLLLKLYYLEELDIQEVSEITNLSVSDIKTTLYRARIKFADLLEKSKYKEYGRV